MNRQQATGRDGFTFAAQMATRLGVLGALVLGLGMLTQMVSSAQVAGAHVGAGLLTATGIWLVTLRQALRRGGGTVLLLIASLLALSGASAGVRAFLSGGFGRGWPIHALIMLAAVTLAEMGAARAKR